MRAALALAFCLLGCATDTIGGDLHMRVIANGGYAAAEPREPRAVLVVSADQYPKVWNEVVGFADLPPVDFGAESVVILLAGPRNTGGWSVDPRGVKLEGRVLVVDAPVQGPAREAMVTQAFTSPYVVIAVDTKDFDSVRWTP